MKKSLSAFAVLFFVVGVGINTLMSFVPFQVGNILFALCVLLGILIQGIDTFKLKSYPTAFALSKDKFLTLLSSLVAVGMFVDFVRQSYTLIEYFVGTVAGSNLFVLTTALNALFCILSCFYYIIVALSYSGSAYDFRLLKAFHFAPLLWIALRVVIAFGDIVNVKTDIHGMLKLLATALGVVAVYFFASELEQSDTKPISVFFFRSFSFVAFTYFFSGITNIAVGKFAFFSEDFVSSLVFMLLGAFVLTFEKSIEARITKN